MADNYKKSVSGSKKKKVNLLEKAVLCKEYEHLYLKDTYPLIVVLNDKEREGFYDKYYSEFSLNADKRENINYMTINISKITEDFLGDKIYLDEYIKSDGSILYILGLFYDTNSLCFGKKRSVFGNAGSRRDSEELFNLEMNAFNKYCEGEVVQKIKK